MRLPGIFSRLVVTLMVAAVFFVLFAVSPKTTAGQEGPPFDYYPEGPSLNQPGVIQYLTGPNEGDPLTIALNFLDQNKQALGLTGADLADYIVTSQYTDSHTGVTHVYLRQRFQNIEVFGADININVAADGSVINAGGNFVSQLASAIRGAVPARAAQQAVADAAGHVGLAVTQALEVAQERGGPAREVVFSAPGLSSELIPVKLVYQPVSPNEVRLAWNVDIAEPSGEHWWSIRVDAQSGELLSQSDYVDHDNWGMSEAGAAAAVSSSRRNFAPPAAPAASRYNVFALPLESPNDGDRTNLKDPANPVASPFGWHDTNGNAGAEYTVTRGNNAHAYTDLDANNLPDPGGDPDGGASLNFNFPLDLSQDPSTYRPAAVTNLFYWNNILHDVLYGYGFTEASGNFQVNNYGRGGKDGDDVRAEAQDGGGTSNANFFTPQDGSRPRMQMYIWPHPLQIRITVNSPSSIAGDYPASEALFGPSLGDVGPLSGDVYLVNDGTSITTDGCQTLIGFPAGGIALIDRGSCNFTVKVKNAQNAGAIAVIIANNQPGDPILMGGTDATIVIPAVMVSRDNGSVFKSVPTLNVTLAHAPLTASRDSDLDNGVIAHEYGHGVSNRLTGGPSSVLCLTNDEQMGEGWSDFFALAFTAQSQDAATTPRGVGSYVMFQGPDGPGIRPTPYTTDMTINPTTYGDIGTLAIPHGVGYAWNSMLWEVYWNLVAAHGFNPDIYGDWTTGGNNLAIQLIMDGMKLQRCRPGFVDGRDAILQADLLLTGGQNQCDIWAGFAKRGLGYSAYQGSTNSTTDGTEAFDMPPSCSP